MQKSKRKARFFLFRGGRPRNGKKQQTETNLPHRRVRCETYSRPLRPAGTVIYSERWHSPSLAIRMRVYPLLKLAGRRWSNLTALGTAIFSLSREFHTAVMQGDREIYRASSGNFDNLWRTAEMQQQVRQTS